MCSVHTQLWWQLTGYSHCYWLARISVRPCYNESVNTQQHTRCSANSTGVCVCIHMYVRVHVCTASVHVGVKGGGGDKLLNSLELKVGKNEVKQRLGVGVWSYMRFISNTSCPLQDLTHTYHVCVTVIRVHSPLHNYMYYSGTPHQGYIHEMRTSLYSGHCLRS